jgi:hypothetical protein
MFKETKMKIFLYSDKTIALNLDIIAANLNRLLPSFHFKVGKSIFTIRDSSIISPKTYSKIDTKIIEESANVDEVLLFTEIPYDNNYFYGSVGNKTIISLFGWDYLTNLSRNNGAVYLICTILIQLFDIGFPHREKNTGCINDFLRDKTGIDICMRCAFMCEKCLKKFNSYSNRKKSDFIHNIQKVLNDLSGASRSGMDICDFWELKKQDESFDVFICHNSNEKDIVRQMNEQLKKSGIKTWFDEEQLPPGRPWAELLERQIETIKSVAIFVGNSGIGPWQDMEIKAFLQEFVKRKCPSIPVILPDCQNVPKLPIFLRQFQWVDFRKKMPDPYENLLWGIKGEK